MPGAKAQLVTGGYAALKRRSFHGAGASEISSSAAEPLKRRKELAVVG